MNLSFLFRRTRSVRVVAKLPLLNKKERSEVFIELVHMNLWLAYFMEWNGPGYWQFSCVAT